MLQRQLRCGYDMRVPEWLRRLPLRAMRGGHGEPVGRCQLRRLPAGVICALRCKPHLLALRSRYIERGVCRCL